MAEPSKLLGLPEELLLLIFCFVYHPWYLDIEIRRNALFECYYEEPMIRVMPSPLDLAPLLTCKLTHRLAKRAILDKFLGLINAQEEHGLDAFEDLVWPARWPQIEPRVKKLYLPSTSFSLVGAKDFILKLSGITSVELFENCGLMAPVGMDVAVSEATVVVLEDDHLRRLAKGWLPVIPKDLSLSCNGGEIELLLHVYFAQGRPGGSPIVDVLFGIGPDSELVVASKTVRPSGIPVTPSTRLCIPPA